MMRMMPIMYEASKGVNSYVGYPSGGALAGVWYDNSGAAPASATGHQIALEAIAAAAHFGNTTAASNRYAQYIIVSPTGTKPDGFNTPAGGFCAWHDYTGDTTLSGGAASSSYGDIAFTNLPYVTDLGTSCGQNFLSGPLDGFSLVAGHEYAETVTDQNPAGGWINTTGSSYTGQENGDECSWIPAGQQGGATLLSLSTGSFVMQGSWSNDTNRCDTSHPIVLPGTGGTPVANFTTISNGLTVNFTDTSTDVGGTIGSHLWSFGDSSTSTTANPAHTYAAVGSYTVTETITDSAGGGTSSKSATVVVTNPLANFTTSINGLTVTFTDASTDAGGSIGAHAWNFGDGSTSTTTNPSHTYAAAGTFSVTETVTDSVNNSTNAKTVPVTVASLGGTPVANFTSAPVGLTVKFTDASTDTGGTIGSYIWSFGDNTTSTSSNPTHTYATPGSYSVTETVKDSVNSKTSSKTTLLSVTSSGGTPQASFTQVANGLTVAFTDTSTDIGGTIGSHAWDFGDGATSTLTNPTHTYASAGSYSVSEKVTDTSNGSSNTKTVQIQVTNTAQLIGNSGFETGGSAPWSMTPGTLCNNTLCIGETAHSGSGFAWLGGYGRKHTDVVSQTITIPAGVSNPTMTFYLHIDTRETTTTLAHDTLVVKALSSTGATLGTLATFSNLNKSTSFAAVTVNMSPYIGKIIKISFTAVEDNSLSTSFVIDDVTLSYN